MADLLVDQLRMMARRHPGEVAYDDLDGRRAITFEQWHTQSNQLARGLAGLGLAKGDRVAIYLPSEHILPWIVSYAAIHKAGAVAVPVNTRLTTRELRTILGHAGVQVVITCSTPGSGGERGDHDTSLADLLAQVRADLPDLRIVIDIERDPPAAPPASDGIDHDDDEIGRAVRDALDGRTPGPRVSLTGADDHGVHVPVADGSLERASSSDLVPSIPRVDAVERPVLSWAEAIDADPDDFQVVIDGSDLADIMYTSGTTGLPKGVAVRHRNAALLRNNEVEFSGDGWLVASPPFTFAGMSFIYNPMKLGMRTLFQARFDATRWIEHVETRRPTSCFLVPAMAQLLLNEPTWPSADLSSLTLVSVGSAPLAPDTLVRLCERLPQASVSNAYGMTEAGPAYCLMPKDQVLARIGSVGQPMPPMEVRIVAAMGPVAANGDPEVLGVNGRGEVQIRAKGRQREYFNDDGATAAAWTDEGWLRTGDLGYLDEDGYLYIIGRLKDVIIRGGNNVDATDVEAVLHEHPAVLDAAVVGVPHDVLGEDIAAFVVLTTPGAVTPETLFAFCGERLADYKRPRQITFVDDLPRNATGKVLKHELLTSLTT